ncbi:MAG: hypothetical protein ABIL09_15760, partial [Gemmatimonadota bacterium]
GDAGATWDCYSASYRSQILGGDRAAWEATFQRQLPELKRAEKRREIVQERVINARLAYVLFEPSTLPDASASPFFYFLKDAEGWKITSHLDTLFHAELERAIASGEYRLPSDRGR